MVRTRTENGPIPTPEKSTTLDTARKKKERKTPEKLERGYRGRDPDERTGERGLEKPRWLEIRNRKTDSVITRCQYIYKREKALINLLSSNQLFTLEISRSILFLISDSIPSTSLTAMTSSCEVRKLFLWVELRKTVIN